MVEELIRQFGRRSGRPELALDEDGCGNLTIDDTGVMLHHRRDTGRLRLWTQVGWVRPSSHDLLLKLLYANALHGSVGAGVIGVSRGNGGVLGVIYSVLLETSPLTLPRFSAALEAFTGMAQAWDEELAACAEHADNSQPDALPPASGATSIWV